MLPKDKGKSPIEVKSIDSLHSTFSLSQDIYKRRHVHYDDSHDDVNDYASIDLYFSPYKLTILFVT